MVNLTVMGIQGASYILINEKTKDVINLIIEFYDCPEVKINDVLIMPGKLLNRFYEGYAQPYAYEKSKKDYSDIKDMDVAFLERKGKRILLERVYG